MSKYSNASNHIDKSVIYVFIAVFFVSVSVFAYRYSKLSPCDDVNFEIVTKKRVVNTLITFEDYTQHAENWQWNFGDSSKTATSSLKKALHTYTKPGEYQVKLLVNNICEQTKTIIVEAEKKIIDSTKYPVFKLPKSITVGEKLIVKDETENASTWEWRFGENARVDATSKRASYIYEEPGLKKVSLIVNGDLEYIKEEVIEVKPLEEVVDNPLIDVPDVASRPTVVIRDRPDIQIGDAPDEPKKKVPYINDTDFSEKLMLVANEKITAKQFSEYFCGDINKSIIVNGRNSSFLIFCEKISGKRRTKIKKLKIFRDIKGSNCITNVTIDCRIPGLFND